MADRKAQYYIERMERAIPYAEKGMIGVSVEAAKEIIGMLKEQEAVKPLREHSGGGTTWWNVCGNCRTAINPNDKFCHECGKKVKWDEDKRSG